MNRLNYSCKKFYSTGAFVNVIKKIFIFIQAALILVKARALCVTLSFRLLTLVVNTRLGRMELITVIKCSIVLVRLSMS